MHQVHFHQEPSYWAGRFSTLRDRLKTTDAHVGFNNIASPGLFSDSEASSEHESYDMAERRRTRMVLQELRSYCRTEAALHSFEEFETEILEKLYKCADPSVFRSRPSLASSEPKLKSDLKPRTGWYFLQNYSHRRNAGNAATTTAQPPHDFRPSMIKSKTTGNLAILGREAFDYRKVTGTLIAGEMTGPESTAYQRGFHWDAQVHAKRIRERRVLAKAEATRNGSGRGSETVLDVKSKETGGNGVAQGWQGDEPPLNGSRKSSGAESLRSLMKGVRKMRRSITGSGSMSGNE